MSYMKKEEPEVKKRTKASKKEEEYKRQISRRGRTGIDKPSGVIDPGAEIDGIGGSGWHVISQIDNQNAKLYGALAGICEE